MTQVRIALVWVLCFNFGYPSGGSIPYELKCISCKKRWTSQQTLGGNCNNYS